MTKTEVIRTAPFVALDLETTGLNPRHDKISVVSLAAQGQAFLIDAFSTDLNRVWQLLDGLPLVVHNAAFDLPFLMRHGFYPGTVIDTMILSQVLMGGDREAGHSLKECAARFLGRAVDKEQQRSDWSLRPLTPAQVEYAKDDTRILLDLYPRLWDLIEAEGLQRVAEIEIAFTPALAWMVANGMPFDAAAWAKVADTRFAEARQHFAALSAMLPPRPPLVMKTKTKPRVWNLNSPKQLAEVFAALGIPVPVMPDGRETTNDAGLAFIDHPFVKTLRAYRKAMKRATAFGPGWSNKGGDARDDARRSCRVYPSWRQIGGRFDADADDLIGGVATGRMACSAPNLQQVPHTPDYRACFRAPAGRKLVKCDLSQIELRIAAKIAGEENMAAIYQRGEDIHRLTAAAILGKKIEDVTKGDRQLAKAVNFGFLYGMGAPKFRVYAAKSYGVILTEEEAYHARSTFFSLYPGLAAWHRSIGEKQKAELKRQADIMGLHPWDDREQIERFSPGLETRTLIGRRRVGVKKFTELANTPVQGSGADMLKIAAGDVYRRRAEFDGLKLVAVVHDEIVIETPAEVAAAAGAWLREIMIAASAPMLYPIPTDAEVTIGDTWGGD